MVNRIAPSLSHLLGVEPMRMLVLLMALVMVTGARPLQATETRLWLGAQAPTDQAGEAVAVLLSAADDGLSPQDYGAHELAEAVARASQGPPWPQPALDRLDFLLTDAMLRYLSHLQSGRVDPRQIHARFALPQRGPKADRDFLRAAVAGNRLTEAVRELSGRTPLAQGLRQVLADYRALEDDPAWRNPLPRPDGRKLVAGDSYPGLAMLARRLQLLGDLDPALPLPTRYDGAIVAAVETFQQRHGLVRDGIVGRNTLRELDVTPARRARQVALTMERLRWTPLLQAPRMVVVNVPEFVLRAYEVVDGRLRERRTMKVIVGKALDTRTPLFDEDMRYIEFSPYWNVPPSIARKELIPKLRTDPGHFDEQGFEFVAPGRQVVRTLTPENLDAVLSGTWRIRQRPGPKNALGDIKFIFPNNDHIFLHHTPATRLFARDRRDFSHGCIRVEQPVELARFVLENEPSWTEERIRASMERGSSRTIRLAERIPVLISYRTVVVKNDRVHFYRDIYGHDALLDEALRIQSARLTQQLQGEFPLP